jgi:hypothetical protein
MIVQIITQGITYRGLIMFEFFWGLQSPRVEGVSFRNSTDGTTLDATFLSYDLIRRPFKLITFQTSIILTRHPTPR